MDRIDTLAAQVAYLTQLVHELAKQLGRGVNAPVFANPDGEGFAPFADGPRIVEVEPGVRMKVVAPLSPRYEPPTYARIFGLDHDGRPENGFPFVGEPSNAGAGRPARSPEGYPLLYAVDGVWLLNHDGRFADVEQLERDRETRQRQNARAATEWSGYRPAGGPP